MLNERIELLERTFRHIATTRMAGVPVLHAPLQVRAVGFAPLPEAPGWLCGVLVTPFHNMLLLSPAHREADVERLLDVLDAALGELTGAAS